MSRPENLIDFPCAFTIKAIGRDPDGLEDLVRELTRKHLSGEAALDSACRESRKGTYLSVSITFTALSQDHLDSIYRELSGHERILFVL